MLNVTEGGTGSGTGSLAVVSDGLVVVTLLSDDGGTIVSPEVDPTGADVVASGDTGVVTGAEVLVVADEGVDGVFVPPVVFVSVPIGGKDVTSLELEVAGVFGPSSLEQAGITDNRIG